MPSKLKKLVRGRREKTGESHAAALAHVKGEVRAEVPIFQLSSPAALPAPVQYLEIAGIPVEIRYLNGDSTIRVTPPDEEEVYTYDGLITASRWPVNPSWMVWYTHVDHTVITEVIPRMKELGCTRASLTFKGNEKGEKLGWVVGFGPRSTRSEPSGPVSAAPEVELIRTCLMDYRSDLVRAMQHVLMNCEEAEKFILESKPGTAPEVFEADITVRYQGVVNHVRCTVKLDLMKPIGPQLWDAPGARESKPNE